MQAQHYLIWTFWIAGFVLAVLSQAGIVNGWIGWIGFWVAVVVALIPRLRFWNKTPAESPQYTPDEIRQFVAEYTRRLDSGGEPCWELLRDRGIWRQSLGEWGESIADLAASMQLNPRGETLIRYWRGVAYYSLGRHAEAADDFSFCIESIRVQKRDSEHLPAFLAHRACTWLCLQEFASAISDIDEIAVLGKLQAEHLVFRGQAWTFQLDFHRALDDFRKAVKLNSKCADAWNGIAYVLATAPDATIRDGTEAVCCARRACELTRWSVWHPISGLAAAWAECGEFDKAVEYAERALELAPDSEKAERSERVKQFRQGQPYRHDRKSHLHDGHAK